MPKRHKELSRGDLQRRAWAARLLTVLVFFGGTFAAAGEVLVPRDSVWSYFRGTEEPSTPPDLWRLPQFDDSSWEAGPAPLHYGDATEGTVLADMRDGYSTVYLRHAFQIEDPSEVETLRFRVDYDDGLVVWINGIEVLRKNAPTALSHDGLAPANHESGTPETILVSDPLLAEYFRKGTNVVAVQGFNASISSSDFVLDLQLEDVHLVADPRVNVERGFFDQPFSVTVTTSTPGATLRYTTDGSSPAEEHGTLYSEPVFISTTTVLRVGAFRPGMEPSRVVTNTYLFLEDVLHQGGQPDGFPLRWGERAADYEMDADVLNDPRYEGKMKRALLAIPAFSLVMDRDEMFGPAGVYSNGGSLENKEWERACSVEMLYPDGHRGFQQNCAIRPHSHTSLKRSFKLLFKSEFGPTKLRFPLFERAPRNAGSAAQQFDRLVLRAGMNRSWSTEWNPGDTCYTRDQWVRDSQVAMSGISAHGTFVHLYIDGLYWGLYNLVERPDAWFTSEYLGGEQDDWFAVNHGGPVSGDASRYERIRQLAEEGGLADSLRYREFRQLVDVALFSDYLILNWYAGTGDWPQNNWYGGNRNRPAGPFLFFCWDAEDVFDPLGSGRAGRSNDGAWVQERFRTDSTPWGFIPRIWHALRQNADFRMLFADRVHRHCFNDGALTEENSRARWLGLNGFIEDAVLGEAARWGDAREAEGDPLRTPDDDWRPEVERVSEVALAGNPERLVEALRAESYYPDIDPPLFNRYDGLVPSGFLLTMMRPGGGGADAAIIYALDGQDPRAPGGGSTSQAAVTYTTAVQITHSTEVRARLFLDDAWSAAATATLYILQDFGKLRFTEIMYHPLGDGVRDGDEFEFVELKNTGAEDLDLSGVRCAGGISFEFPFGTRLAPGGLAVLAANAYAFRARYPSVAEAGVYQGRLSNGGERLELQDPEGNVFASVLYGDDGAWPRLADGAGYSLVTVSANPAGDPNDPAAWTASRAPDGSPGADENAVLMSPPSITRQPEGAELREGERGYFEVVASGMPIPTYQWLRDGAEIPGASEWILEIGPVTKADDGARFSCVVANGYGTMASEEVTLEVLAASLSGELLEKASTWRHVRGNAEPSRPADLWRMETFDDSGWQPAILPIGYGNQPLATVLDDMRSSYSVVYLRARFTVPRDVQVDSLTLRADYDDGMIAWINGVEVLRANAPEGDVGHDRLAVQSHESGAFESFPLADPQGCVRAGENTIAIQGLNASLDSSGFKLDVRLDYRGTAVETPVSARFLRGDTDGDLVLDMSDAVRVLNYLYLGGDAPPCEDAADANDDGWIDMSDAVRILAFLFVGAKAPAPPFSEPGVDPTGDELSCERSTP